MRGLLAWLAANPGWHVDVALKSSTDASYSITVKGVVEGHRMTHNEVLGSDDLKDTAIPRHLDEVVAYLHRQRKLEVQRL